MYMGLALAGRGSEGGTPLVEGRRGLGPVPEIDRLYTKEKIVMQTPQGFAIASQIIVVDQSRPVELADTKPPTPEQVTAILRPNRVEDESTDEESTHAEA